MYAWILSKIPLPWWVKAILVLLILAGIALICFQFFFPWLAEYLPYPVGNLNYPE